MAILCLLALLAGWRIGFSAYWQSPLVSEIPAVRSVTIIITAIALTSWLGIELRPLEERASSTWSGPLTILSLFADLKIISLSLSGILFLHSRSRLALALFVANALLYAPLLLIYFRRRAMVEFAAVLALAIWFGRRRVLPRVVVIVGLAAGSLVTFAAGHLRGLAVGHDGEWQMPSIEQVTSTDFLSLMPFENDASAPELLNALGLVYVASTNNFTWGKVTWNRFVFQYVPAQIVGAEIKNDLMIDTGLESMLQYREAYSVPIGTTGTGIGESFVEFGYFGCVFFLLIGIVMGRYWKLGCKGDIRCQALYSVGLILAVTSITHYPAYFFVNFLFFWIVLNVGIIGFRLVTR